MFDELLNLVKEATGSAVNNTPDVSNDQTDAIAQHAHGSILSELQAAVAGGGLSSIMGMFGGGQSNSNVAGNATTQNIVEKVAGSLASKFGISPETASSLTSSIIPTVLSKLSGKANDPNDNSISLGGIESALSGLMGGSSNNNSTGGLLGTLKNLI
ncbi:hypothetical protein A9P82_12265 [Arachidicoccus ginsenosidimutans]|uniref:hypothetical protein n=1 Tax=Arachidicoccus sp. BS20 TaxID=1850526 RepID=UPI0007F0D8BC|nr:hypothetical protein [Arachidicoccus sp. BS20]ANI89991.1 hypothetical protein A9P82_12265 [Arachidicoccus sp. BS20]